MSNEEIWKRGQDALARILKHVPVEKIEKLADKVEDKDFRSSMKYKMFMNSLKEK
jgi:hypothetical protein